MPIFRRLHAIYIHIPTLYYMHTATLPYTSILNNIYLSTTNQYELPFLIRKPHLANTAKLEEGMYNYIWLSDIVKFYYLI